MPKINFTAKLIGFLILVNSTAALAFEDKDVRATVIKLGGVEKFLRMMADSQSKNLPQQLNSETQLLSMLATDSTMHLQHQMVKIQSKKEVDSQFIKNFIKFQTTKVCTSPVSNILINEFGAKYRYYYLSQTGENIFTFDVLKKNCLALK
jgi:hypothetical protein